MQKTERARGEVNSKGSNQKTFINAGAISKSFDVFDFTQKAEDSQHNCFVCNPSSKNQDPAHLCTDHRAEAETLTTALFVRLAKPRKIVRLHRCLSCNQCFAPSKFSQFYGICRNCVATAEGKSKTAQSNFVERTANNIRKILRGALAL